MPEIKLSTIRDAVFYCRTDPAWHSHYSEEAKKAIAALHAEMDPHYFDMEAKRRE